MLYSLIVSRHVLIYQNYHHHLIVRMGLLRHLHDDITVHYLTVVLLSYAVAAAAAVVASSSHPNYSISYHPYCSL